MSHRIFVRDEKIRRTARARATATAGKPKTSSQRQRAPRRLPRAAVESYRALPAELTKQVGVLLPNVTQAPK